MHEIEFSRISKSYKPGLLKKKIQAVRELSLGVEKGEVFGLIGPNGAGKSSAIRMLLGLSTPDEGTVLFRGRKLADTDLKKEVGYLPENPYLYDYLTLREILHFCAKVSRLDEKTSVDRGRELMGRLDLLEAQNRPLRTFSKGMLQRAAICFALLHDPSLIILDEPMSGLDPIGRRQVVDLVLELKNRGKTIFFCSHILTDVERLCDRIGLMVSGRLVHTFDRVQFRHDEGYQLHFVVSPLSECQRRGLSALISDSAEEDGHTVISFSTANLATVARQLETSGVQIISGRNDRFSLEETFMQMVEENR